MLTNSKKFKELQDNMNDIDKQLKFAMKEAIQGHKSAEETQEILRANECEDIYQQFLTSLNTMTQSSNDSVSKSDEIPLNSTTTGDEI